MVNNVYDDATDHAAAAAASLAAWTSDVHDSSPSDSSLDHALASSHRSRAKPAPLCTISVPKLGSVAVHRVEAERTLLVSSTSSACRAWCSIALHSSSVVRGGVAESLVCHRADFHVFSFRIRVRVRQA